MTRTGPATAFASIAITAAAGTAAAGDFSAAAAAHGIAADKSSQSVRWNTIEDDVDEADESFTLTLAPVASDGYRLAAGEAVFDVSLSVAGTSDVLVDYATSNGTAAAGSDYTAVSGTLTFPRGSTAPREVRVPILNDTVDESETETFALVLRNVRNGSLAGGGSTLRVVGRIEDDDDPEVTASFGRSSYEAREGASVTVQVTLNRDPEREVTIDLERTHRGGVTDADYSGVPASVTFASGATRRAFLFAATQDAADDDGEAVVLRFATPLPERVAAGGPTTLAILDDDGPPAAVFELVGAVCEDELCRAVTGEVVRFIDTSTGKVLSRRWTFGDGTTSDLLRVDHSWSAPGFHDVTLTVSDEATVSTARRKFLVEASAPAGTCEPDAGTLCLQDSRYSVSVDWWTADGESGAADVVHEGTNDSGLFTFFSRENWEILIKVLNGCEINGHAWVYAASTTDLGYAIRVTDTVTETVKEYRNEAGRSAPAITDATAFRESCGG